MNSYPPSFAKLIEKFKMLPGVGQKTAERYAFHLLRKNRKELEVFANAVLNFKDTIKICRNCFALSDSDLCHICSDDKRDSRLLCVVENITDMYAIEKSNSYEGLYHILQGVLSPMDGITPENLRLRELLAKVKNGGLNEIIIATNSSLEGESTAVYISEMLKNEKTNNSLKISRIASGIPIGGNLKYIDKMTMKKAIDDRKSF